MSVSGLLEFLRSGLRVTTMLDDGSPGAEFVLQPDGDVINRVSPAFVNDPAAQRRHAERIRAALTPLRRMRIVTRSLAPTAGATATAWLALHHHALPAAIALGPLAWTVVQYVKRSLARKSL